MMSSQIPVSYMICKDDSTTSAIVKSINGTTCSVDYSGKDIKTVIEKTVNKMNHGQTLFIKSGAYSPSDVINIKKAINIIGEGIVSSGTWMGTTINRNGSVMNVEVPGILTNPIIENIGFNGGNRKEPVLSLNGFHGSLYNVVVTGGDIGIDAQNSWSTRYFNVVAQSNNIGCRLGSRGVSNSNFFGCRFYTNIDIGALLLSGQQIGFYGCTFESNGQYGISIEGYETVTLDGCYFELHPNYNIANINSGGHIKLGTTAGGPNIVKISSCSLGKLDTNVNVTDANRILLVDGNNILVENCSFYQNPGENARTDINNNQEPYANILLINCKLHHDGGWIVKGPVGIKAIGTNGFLTENSGTAIGIGTQQSIPHGLVVEPSIVLLSNKDNAANPYQSASPDKDNIYITASINKSYTWEARA